MRKIQHEDDVASVQSSAKLTIDFGLTGSSSDFYFSLNDIVPDLFILKTIIFLSIIMKSLHFSDACMNYDTFFMFFKF